MMPLRQRIFIRGEVQGVGFRPFVFHLAQRLGITGFVLNSSAGVIVEAEAAGETIDEFVVLLQSERPPLATIDTIDRNDLSPTGEVSFTIVDSTAEPGQFAPVPPDVATCDDCWRELFDSHDRRHAYPFINCTNCGPRFTVIRDLPYDRRTTTMATFPMCQACEAEYRDPANRRFHAEPIACPECGPGVALVRSGEQLPATFFRNAAETMRQVRALLGRGEIVAVRGLGGFQLACDASNDAAIRRLRERKRRPHKPFAVMVRDLAVAQQIAAIGDEERELLEGRERPIAILSRRDDTLVAASVAPDNRTLGVMLPCTPLHALLFDEQLGALVMTSGNLSEEPIVTANDEALTRLAGVADWFLIHNRDIEVRVDDSVVRLFEGKPRALRRARALAPRVIDLGIETPELLACGAELKNTFTLTKGRRAISSQHIGDLSNFETLAFFEETLAHLKRLFRIMPAVVVHDLHPLYMSTRFALASGLPTVGVQHHHAHIASCMAENGVRERVIGVAMDGTGYGLDGKIWGGEFFVGDFGGFERRAHFRYVALAGGDAAIRQPWRAAMSFLRDAGVELKLPVPEQQRRLVATMLERNLNVFETSSCGRLFDAVSSIAGLRQEISFEGQAAIDLEMAADLAIDSAYPYQIDGDEIDFRPTIRAIVHDHGTAAIAAKFHNTLADATAAVCERIRQRDGLERVCLSGGVFQNALLLQRTLARLRERRFDVLVHSVVPPNDGGISLGQAAIAAERIRRGEIDVPGHTR